MSLWGSLASPSSDDANPAGFMSFKRISLKSKSLFFFFFFKEYDQSGKKRRNNHGEVSCPENKVCKCLFKASHVASEGYLVAGKKKNPKAFPVKRLILLQPLWVSPSFESAQQEKTAVSDHRLH